MRHHATRRTLPGGDARRPCRRTLIVILVSWLAGAGGDASAADAWPRLRGEAGAGHSTGRLAADWETGAWAWAIDLPGVGHASPVVQDGRVIVASADPATGMRWLTAVRLADGAVVWQIQRPGDAYDAHHYNSLASSTPALDEAGTYWPRQIDGRVVLEALGHDGSSRWQVDLGEFPSQHGFGGSPAARLGLVVLPLESDGPSRVVALDAATGAEAWSLPRETSRTSYSTPLVRDGTPPLVILSSMTHGVSGVDALTGRLLWERRCLPRRAVSSPVVATKTAAGPLALATCGDGGGNNLVVALHLPPADADAATADPAAPVVEPSVAWTLDRSVAPYLPAPLVTAEAVYLWNDRGVVCRVEPATGRIVWRGRVGGNYFASPVGLRGGVLNVSSDGELVLVADAEEFRVLGTRAIDGVVRATPAAVGDRLLVRTDGRLLALPLVHD